MAIPKAYQVSSQPKKSEGQKPIPQKFWQRTFVRYVLVFFVIGCASFMVGKKIFHYASYLKVLKSIGVSEPGGFSIGIGKKGHAQTEAVSAGTTPAPAATPPQNGAPENAASSTPPPPVEKDPTQPSQAFDPLSISTEQEVKLLQNLAERRKNLDKREKEIAEKERIIEVSKKEVLDKLTELEKIKKAIESTLNQIDKTEKEKFDRLIKMYEGMKPKEAAKIFNQMDVKMLKDLFLIMNEKKLAAIMATMNPMKAKEVTGNLMSQKNPFSVDGKAAAPSAPEGKKQ
jgi:flagellar motility protein MotE (MotC chaperone)